MKRSTWRLVAAVTFALGVVIAFALYQAQQDDICKGQNDAREIVRNLLRASETTQAGGQKIPVTIIYPDGTRQEVLIQTKGADRRTKRFYAEQIEAARPISCT